MPLILAHRRQRQADFCEIKPRLVYIVSSKTTGTQPVTQRNPIFKNKNTKNKILSYILCIGETWSCPQRPEASGPLELE